LKPAGFPGPESNSMTSKASPSRERIAAIRSSGTARSLVNRSPSTHRPSLVRAATASSSAAETHGSFRRLREIGIGVEGWLITGAITDGSTAVASAKPPVKHMPMTPTPRPGVRPARSAANALRKSAIGRCALVANARNSLAMHTRAKVLATYPPLIGLPGVPNGDGTTTVKPWETRWSARPSTSGVMPGISGTSTTPGPAPFS
jgi:hypothetical protein